MLNVYQMFLILEMGSYDNNNNNNKKRKFTTLQHFYLFTLGIQKKRYCLFFITRLCYSFTIPVKILLVFPHFVVQMLHYQNFFLTHTIFYFKNF
jgi:hypothetical protein